MPDAGSKLYPIATGPACVDTPCCAWITETLDGDVLLREYNTHRDFNNRWKISPWPEQYRDNSGKVVACIRATKENVGALEAFAEKLRDLTKTLANFVAPENIEETLAQITSGSLRLLGSK